MKPPEREASRSSPASTTATDGGRCLIHGANGRQGDRRPRQRRRLRVAPATCCSGQPGRPNSNAESQVPAPRPKRDAATCAFARGRSCRKGPYTMSMINAEPIVMAFVSHQRFYALGLRHLRRLPRRSRCRFARASRPTDAASAVARRAWRLAKTSCNTRLLRHIAGREKYGQRYVEFLKGIVGRVEGPDLCGVGGGLQGGERRRRTGGSRKRVSPLGRAGPPPRRALRKGQRPVRKDRRHPH